MTIHQLSIFVIDEIYKIPELSNFEIHKLKNIPLGYLRKPIKQCWDAVVLRKIVDG